MNITASDLKTWLANNMSRYFIEVAYKGTRYSGFQIQENAVTIQAEIQKAFAILHRQSVILTGSSRTDSGVHALQNFFHFDYYDVLDSQFVYKMNAILTGDIVVKNLYQMSEETHARFDALSRSYYYSIHRFKNPFIKATSYYYPYQLDLVLLREAAWIVNNNINFFAFAKTNSQVKTYQCEVKRSEWLIQDDEIKYHIESNRFLRGMVRMLTAAQLKVGRGLLGINDFRSLFEGNKKCGYSVPPQGLFLESVKYPAAYFPATGFLLHGDTV